MKKTYLMLALFVIIPHIYAQEKLVTYWDNGNIKLETFLKNGLIDSTYHKYYENGKIKEQGFYVEKSGKYPFRCFDMDDFSGRVKKENYKYEYGLKHGNWKYYYPNGQIERLENYSYGCMNGNFFDYDSLGNLTEYAFYQQGGQKILSQSFYEGKLDEVYLFNREYNEKSKIYTETKRTIVFSENGEVEEEYIEISEHKSKKVRGEKYYSYERINLKEKEKIYYPNGLMESEEQYNEDGKKDGLFAEYYENGFTKYGGLFKDGIPVKKHYYFNAEGYVDKIVTYKKGKIVKEEIPKERITSVTLK